MARKAGNVEIQQKLAGLGLESDPAVANDDAAVLLVELQGGDGA